MQIEDFYQIAVVGAVLSFIIQWTKNKFGTDALAIKAVTIALSIIIGTVWVVFRETPAFQTILIILGTASTVYALLLK